MSVADLRRDVERPHWHDADEQAKNEFCTCGYLRGPCQVHGYEWKRMIGMLRRDPRFTSKSPTHTWRLDETAGRLKLYDIKRLG